MTLTGRASGVLVHVTSLATDYGIGDLGPTSYEFVDLLCNAKQRYWQILPLTPTNIRGGNSPYQPTSAFAGNILLISPELLINEGLISKDYAETLKLPAGKVNFEAVTAKKHGMIKKAYANRKQAECFDARGFEEFCEENSTWLEDYTLFEAIKGETKLPWHRWSKLLRDRNPSALKRKESCLSEKIGEVKFAQYLFFKQFVAFKSHCKNQNVRLIGDVPFYVSYESCDVWAHSEFFKLDKQKRPLFVSGVPPDYFSKTGQLWGNPVYDWCRMEQSGFQWWIQRIAHSLKFLSRN